MIIIPRKAGESVVIGENIIVTVIEVQGDEVRLRVEHAQGEEVHRQEVFEALQHAEAASKRPR